MKVMEDLRTLYAKQNMSTTEIANLKKCDHKTVINHLERIGVPRRSRRHNGGFLCCAFCAEVLRWLYHDKKMSGPQIARLFGVRDNLIAKWMVRCGIPMRNHSEANMLRPRKLHTKSRRAVKRNGKKWDWHRWLMQQHLGRKLRKNEVVHHKDGNIHNNSIDNLEVMTRRRHGRLHALLKSK